MTVKELIKELLDHAELRYDLEIYIQRGDLFHEVVGIEVRPEQERVEIVYK